MSSAAEAEQRNFLKLLAEWTKTGENSECADCTAKRPTWASVNLGVYICIRCSGIHRSFGSHISFVRSTTIDKWTPKQIDTMRNVGNTKARLYYEANKPAGKPKPSEHENDNTVKNYITDKYVRKLWADKGPAPHELLNKKPSVTTARPAVSASAPVSPSQAKPAESEKKTKTTKTKKTKVTSASTESMIDPFSNLHVDTSLRAQKKSTSEPTPTSAPSHLEHSPFGNASFKPYLPHGEEYNDDDAEEEILEAEEVIEEEESIDDFYAEDKPSTPNPVPVAEPQKTESITPAEAPLQINTTIKKKKVKSATTTPTKKKKTKTASADGSEKPKKKKTPASAPASSPTVAAKPAETKQKVDSILSLFDPPSTPTTQPDPVPVVEEPPVLYSAPAATVKFFEFNY